MYFKYMEMDKMVLVNPITKNRLSKKDYLKLKKFSGILDLYKIDDSQITKIQSDFYNNVKFPNYDNIDSFGTLLDKAKQSVFAKMLDDEIPYHSNVLEAGCGTGQLSIFLSRFNRKIYGIDISKGSLIEAKKFINKNLIKNVRLYRMNLFNLFFQENTFDLVISNGVLHHTHNAELAFSNLCKVLKQDGIIVIGLYHKYGRLFHKLRKFLTKNIFNKLIILDKRFRQNLSLKKKYAWYKDQYENPFETVHTFNEVIKWFNTYNIEYLSSIPFDFDQNKKLFSKNKLRSSYEYFLEEIFLTINPRNISEGGFFIMIGKKRK